MENYFERIKQLRLSRGTTQKELASLLGMTPNAYQKYEYGEYDTGKMMLRNAIALADALECDVRELMEH